MMITIVMQRKRSDGDIQKERNDKVMLKEMINMQKERSDRDMQEERMICSLFIESIET